MATAENSPDTSTAGRPWKPEGTPFFWVPKEAFTRIEEGLERGAAIAKLVYSALCIIANREGSAVFEKPIGYIAPLASVDRRTVERILPELERLRLVTIERRKLKQPHRYTLATFSRSDTTKNPNDTSQSRSDATGSKLQPVALPKEQENQRTGGAPISRNQKLSTADRISLEHAKKILEQRIEKLKDATCYEHDREANPDMVAELQTKRVQLAELDERLLGGVL